MNKEKMSQGERIARILHLLITNGGKSYPELEKKFPMFHKITIERDIKLLKHVGLVTEKREAKNTDGKDTRKKFMFFKDEQDIIGKTEEAMVTLKKDYNQVTLDQIASTAGFPPSKVEKHAYALAPKLKLLIGKNEISKPPQPLMAGKQNNA